MEGKQPHGDIGSEYFVEVLRAPVPVLPPRGLARLHTVLLFDLHDVLGHPSYISQQFAHEQSKYQQDRTELDATQRTAEVLAGVALVDDGGTEGNYIHEGGGGVK